MLIICFLKLVVIVSIILDWSLTLPLVIMKEMRTSQGIPVHVICAKGLTCDRVIFLCKEDKLEETKEKLGDRLIYSHFYRVINEASHTNTPEKPNREKFSTPSSSQLLITDFMVSSGKRKRNGTQRIEQAPEIYKQTRITNFALPKLPKLKRNSWERRLDAEFQQLEENAAFLNDIEGDDLITNVRLESLMVSW